MVFYDCFMFTETDWRGFGGSNPSFSATAFAVYPSVTFVTDGIFLPRCPEFRYTFVTQSHGIRRLSARCYSVTGVFSAPLSGVQIYFCNASHGIRRLSARCHSVADIFSASLSGVRINYLYHITRHSPFIRPLLFSNGHFFCLATVKSLQAAL